MIEAPLGVSTRAWQLRSATESSRRRASGMTRADPGGHPTGASGSRLESTVTHITSTLNPCGLAQAER